MAKQRVKPEGKPPKRPSTKEELLTRLEGAFRSDPQKLWAYLPEVAEKAQQMWGRKGSSARTFSIYLTERERDYRLNSLQDLLKRCEDTRALSREETIKALEHLAALQEHGEEFRLDVLKAVEKSLPLPLDLEQNKVLPISKGTEHRTYSLARGVILHLTWDGRLIKIELNAKELEARRKFLSVAGIGTQETRSDVSVNHDKYLWETVNER